MMAGWTLVEPCCGSAALTWHLLGARRQLLPYQGSKWLVRHPLEGVVRRLGFFGQPSAVVLGDVAPWGLALVELLRHRELVATLLQGYVGWGETDPEGLYGTLHGRPVPEHSAALAAQLLWLQRMAWSGKAVGVRAGRWLAPGLNVTSARGVPATDRFGEVKPLGRALLREVERAPQLATARGYLGTLPAPDQVEGPTLVLLDLPYEGTTPYPCGHMPRAEGLAYAQAWHAAGAAVIVCEAEPLPLDGWQTQRLAESAGRGTLWLRARRSGKGAEWVTFRAARAAVRAA